MRRLREEDGAIAILTAVLLVAVFGFAAISVDVGALYEERRQLQNGADAAALAAAWDCAEGLVPCAITGLQLNDTADTYANLNARDDESAADIVELNLAEQYITVETSTVSNDNGFLRNWFAGVIGHETSTLRARATAAWGQAGGAAVLPLTFHLCEFERLAGDPPVFPSDMKTVLFHDPGQQTPDPDTCASGPAGQNYAGGFGWLDDTDGGSCSATIDTEGTAEGSVSNGAPSSNATTGNPNCNADFFDQLLEAGEPVLIPIYRSVSGTGSNAQYVIDGFAALKLDSYRLLQGNPAYTSSPPPPQAECRNNQTCIRGQFVEYISYADYIDPAAGNYGVTAVVLKS